MSFALRERWVLCRTTPPSGARANQLDMNRPVDVYLRMLLIRSTYSRIRKTFLPAPLIKDSRNSMSLSELIASSMIIHRVFP